MMRGYWTVPVCVYMYTHAKVWQHPNQFVKWVLTTLDQNLKGCQTHMQVHTVCQIQNLILEELSLHLSSFCIIKFSNKNRKRILNIKPCKSNCDCILFYPAIAYYSHMTEVWLQGNCWESVLCKRPKKEESSFCQRGLGCLQYIEYAPNYIEYICNDMEIQDKGLWGLKVVWVCVVKWPWEHLFCVEMLLYPEITAVRAGQSAGCYINIVFCRNLGSFTQSKNCSLNYNSPSFWEISSLNIVAKNISNDAIGHKALKPAEVVQQSAVVAMEAHSGCFQSE